MTATDVASTKGELHFPGRQIDGIPYGAGPRGKANFLRANLGEDRRAGRLPKGG